MDLLTLMLREYISLDVSSLVKSDDTETTTTSAFSTAPLQYSVPGPFAGLLGPSSAGSGASYSFSLAGQGSSGLFAPSSSAAAGPSLFAGLLGPSVGSGASHSLGLAGQGSFGFFASSSSGASGPSSLGSTAPRTFGVVAPSTSASVPSQGRGRDGCRGRGTGEVRYSGLFVWRTSKTAITLLILYTIR